MSEVLENIAETDGEVENAEVDVVEEDMQVVADSALKNEITEPIAKGESSSSILFVAVANIFMYPRRVAPSCTDAALTVAFFISVIHSIQDTAPHSQ
jgi:hypothetical protein